MRGDQPAVKPGREQFASVYCERFRVGHPFSCLIQNRGSLTTPRTPCNCAPACPPARVFKSFLLVFCLSSQVADAAVSIGLLPRQLRLRPRFVRVARRRVRRASGLPIE